ncbi:hypothetical protein BC936DRAFT_137887 [Jimgerdemannia flammicorona]|uniref:Uncharacterized protein n=1 Tax=Jimgerdemannia flammicorona TaxID=994334 RepID=A0A433DIS3_9FUNG|nr:hypothetical protein BC936DRAFT_137887 [Jimgerdemannia flammicorona]
MHHSEELWTDAQKFWPERFEQEEKAGKSCILILDSQQDIMFFSVFRNGVNNLSMNSNIISFMSLTRPSSFMHRHNHRPVGGQDRPHPLRVGHD